MKRNLAIMAASAAVLALTPPALAKLDTRGADLENWWKVKTQSMSLAFREIIRLPDSATPSGGKSWERSFRGRPPS